jgi:hypothetical protein
MGVNTENISAIRIELMFKRFLILNQKRTPIKIGRTSSVLRALVISTIFKLI